MHNLRIGISGWTYAGWRGVFYPPDVTQKRELEYASRQLNSVEINGTFYSLQRPSSFQTWYDATPPDFRFAIDHAPNPINAYGRSKLAGEQAAGTAHQSLIVRLSWLYGAGGSNFVRAIATRARRGEPLRVVNDQVGSPSWTGDVAPVILALLAQHERGIFHVANTGQTSWYGLAQAIAQILGISVPIQSCPSSAYPTRAMRPRFSVLDTRATQRVTGLLRPWREALEFALHHDSF